MVAEVISHYLLSAVLLARNGHRSGGRLGKPRGGSRQLRVQGPNRSAGDRGLILPAGQCICGVTGPVLDTWEQPHGRAGSRHRRAPRTGGGSGAAVRSSQLEGLREAPPTGGRPPAVGNAELDAGRRPAADSAVTRILPARSDAYCRLKIFVRNTAICPRVAGANGQ